MAEVQQQSTGKRNRRRRGVTVPQIRIDMTPMVDLAFLLLTFFVLTAELSKENAIAATFPKSTENKTPVEGMTLLIGDNSENFFWYRGKFDPSLHLNSVKTKNTGLFNVLKDANTAVFTQVELIDRQHNLGLLKDEAWKNQRSELLKDASIPFVVVKWNEDAPYASVVAAIDMLNRTHNSKYAIVTMSEAEKAMLKEQKK